MEMRATITKRDDGQKWFTLYDSNDFPIMGYVAPDGLVEKFMKLYPNADPDNIEHVFNPLNDPMFSGSFF